MDNNSLEDRREISIGRNKYAISITPSGSDFLGAWRCPTCKVNSDGLTRMATRADAISWAEAMAKSHHAEHHRNESDQPKPSE